MVCDFLCVFPIFSHIYTTIIHDTYCVILTSSSQAECLSQIFGVSNFSMLVAICHRKRFSRSPEAFTSVLLENLDEMSHFIFCQQHHIGSIFYIFFWMKKRQFDLGNCLAKWRNIIKILIWQHLNIANWIWLHYEFLKGIYQDF